MAVKKKDREDTINTALNNNFKFNSDGTKLTNGRVDIKISPSGGTITYDRKDYHRGADVRNQITGK